MRPGALERLTPPWEDAKILERAGGLDDGGTIHMVISRGPIKVNWKLKHTDFRPGELFRDEQVSGPLGKWVHSHWFRPAANGGCVVGNEVEWEPPLGSMANMFARPVVEGELLRLCEFRKQRLLNDLGRHASAGDPGELKVAITGASGLIGSSLTHFLTTAGHTVYPIVRRKAGEGEISWDPMEGRIDRDALEGVDAVVHLAGESIAGGRWTAQKKRAIWKSRIDGTRVLVDALNQMRTPPRVLVSSSAVGFYGDRGNESLSEESKPGKGFLADLCQEWEGEALKARQSGVRVVLLRTGLVLSPAGGALGSMLLPFKMGVGGRLGSGRQYVSWIDHDDLVGLYYHAIVDSTVRGPVNGTAPHPVPNATFTSTLGRVLHRPTFLPVPGLAVKALFGEMGQALLLEGARVFPTAAQRSGFTFQFEGLEDSLRFQLGKPEERHV